MGGKGGSGPAGSGDAGEPGSAGARMASRPQHLLLTLLGDYWYQRHEAISSAALVSLLRAFDVSEQNARAALSRLARRGLLEPHREGRHTRYQLTARAHAILADGTERIFAFGQGPDPWDGTWTCVSFSVPETRRATRATLRTRLRWLGFAPLYDAAWYAPGDRADAAAEMIAELQPLTATVITGPVRGNTGGDPARAWDLDALRARYESFITGFTPIQAQAQAGERDAQQALLARTAIIDVWRAFPALDPELPAEFLPPNWPQAAAARIFRNVYDMLGPLATSRVREIIAEQDPDAAALTSHHTSADPHGTNRAPAAPGAAQHASARVTHLPSQTPSGR